MGLKPPYMGHYIVLCGYDQRINKFLYRNPAFKDSKNHINATCIQPKLTATILSGVCFMSFDAMDRSRRVSGTDEDLILIYQNEP